MSEKPHSTALYFQGPHTEDEKVEDPAGKDRGEKITGASRNGLREGRERRRWISNVSP
ncbi:hypothetical protein RUM43_003952, partial [Polyplax serrata]